jgi:hypothetical protein
MDNIVNGNQINTSRSKVQDFFLYLFGIICLYVSSVTFITLLYSIINNYFGDVLFDYYSNSGVKWAIASLIIFFPLYLWLSSIINKSIIKNPDTANLGIRKVLYYFTLFVAGLTIAIDLVTLIFYFLDGEITTRFILKVIAVLLVGGVVFWHYLYDLRRDVTVISHRSRNTAIVVSILVLVALVFGFVVAGSPVMARKIKFDNQRTSDLSSIQGAITEYYRNNNSLPVDLVTLSKSVVYYGFDMKDPKTLEDYEYRIITNNSYELCANFETDDSDKAEVKNRYVDTWYHGIGRQCFERPIGASDMTIKEPQY